MTEYARERLLQVAGYLPRPLRQTIYSLPKEMQGELEEICLRNGRPMTVLTREGEILFESWKQIVSAYRESTMPML